VKIPKLKPGETASFYLNPYFNELIAILEPVPTSQDKFKPVDTEKSLFQLYEKNNVTEFKKRIRERLLARKKPWWPYTEYLTLVVSITGPKKDIEKKDLDNYLKTLFDTLKGVVFDEDYKIFAVEARKDFMEFKSGFTIAISPWDPNSDKPIPHYLFSTNKDHWKEERELKIKNREIYCIDFY
jgi:Holliday junction resolvase RusA-like endonuclease